MKRTTIAAILCAALLVPATAACDRPEQVSFRPGTTMDKISRAGRLTVGVKFDQPGQGFRNLATGEKEGFDIEIAKIVAVALGLTPRQIHYKEIVSSKRQAALQHSQVDIVVASYSITAERRKQVGQAGPYYLTDQRLLVREEDKDRFRGPEDVHDVLVCSVKDSTSAATIRTYTARLIEESTYTPCVQRLLNREVDVVTTDSAILHSYEAQQQDKLEVVGRGFRQEEWGIGYRKGDLDFCRFLTDTLSEALNNGDWQRAFDETLGRLGVPAPTKPTPESC
jgi:glutamate transport system substrate-binding protein